MAKVALPVVIDAAEAALHQLASWMDAAEGGERTAGELDSSLVHIQNLVEEQRVALHAAVER